MADIVEASGVATGTLYRYFGNKDAVVMAVSEFVVGVDFDAHDAPVALPVAMDVLMGAAENIQLGQLGAQVWSRAIDSPQLRSMIELRHQHVCRWLARAIEQCETDEPSPQALQSAEIIVCAISGLAERLATGLHINSKAFRHSLNALLPSDQPKHQPVTKRPRRRS